MNQEKELVQNLIRARNEFQSASPPTDLHINNLEAAQQRLLLAQTKKAQYATNINHINYAGSGERMSRYHFLRSGRGKASREIPKLVINMPDGIRTLEGSSVHQHMFAKYSDIVKEDPLAGTMSIEDFLGPELTQSLRLCPLSDHPSLIAPVMDIEIKSIVKELKSCSAPGPLGLTNNLMKEIIPYMLDILTNLGNSLLFDDEMPAIDPFFFHRLVVFILKPGKSCLDPDSYRGLSLLEGFFKIFSKILASRLQRPLLHIQDPQQFGFTKGKGCLEASRTVLDTIQYAKSNARPLIIISTDLKKAFDSISLNHIEATLNIYQFPAKFTTAFMRMVRNGTMQFEINSNTSEDHDLLAGSGQGDPKSSGAYNISAAPLNHYLAKSPEVPRFKVNGIEITPVFYADDELTLLQGDKIDEILMVLRKIEQYRLVSGLFLNLPKCEIMAINCNEAEVTRLIQATNMQRVTTLKHLGLLINENGILSHDDNIAPVQTAMENIANSFNTLSSTPLGRSLYAKFLLSSRYLHKIQNFSFSTHELASLRNSVLRLTWTRHRVSTDSSSTRVHIANDRVAQPLGYGGLSIPDPHIQTQALKLSWVRKFQKLDHNLAWTKILEFNLAGSGRPDISTHLKLGYNEWICTSKALLIKAPFWADVFQANATIMKLSHQFDKCWPLTPITGHEDSSFDHIDISSLTPRNPVVMNMINAGCYTVGHLFNLNQHGHININDVKDFNQLELQFGVQISAPVRNSITGLVNRIRAKHRQSNASFFPDDITTIQSLIRTQDSGCWEATRLLLTHERDGWEWGHFPRSYSTYLSDGRINISSQEFSRSFYLTRNSALSPAVQWTSLQILLRTLWTKVKENRTLRNQMRQDPVDSLCSNCGLFPEHTTHLIYDCPLAQQIWILITKFFNEGVTEQAPDHSPINLSEDNVMYNYPPPVLTGQCKTDLIDMIMMIKHIIYRLKFRNNLQVYPSVRFSVTIAALDLERAVSVRNYHNTNATLMSTMLLKIREQVGF